MKNCIVLYMIYKRANVYIFQRQMRSDVLFLSSCCKLFNEETNETSCAYCTGRISPSRPIPSPSRPPPPRYYTPPSKSRRGGGP